MLKKEYEQMSEFFTQILALDPDNASVALWRKEIEAFNEETKLKLQQKEVLAAIRKNAWAVYGQGLKIKKSGKYHTAIATFKSAIELGPNEKKVIVLAKEQIGHCRGLISRAREPVLVEAKKSEAAGDLFRAFKLYKQATQIDPPHPAGHSGMSRVKGILHDRSKLTYTEAIISESYSDFANAKKLFKECLDNSPVDDLYHERAARKLAHYYEKPESPSP
jgi:tetratricopeptide (TPR) repeat protein